MTEDGPQMARVREQVGWQQVACPADGRDRAVKNRCYLASNVVMAMGPWAKKRKRRCDRKGLNILEQNMQRTYGKRMKKKHYLLLVSSSFANSTHVCLGGHPFVLWTRSCNTWEV